MAAVPAVEPGEETVVDLNLVVLSGRVAVDPEMRTFESGSSLIRYLVTTRTEDPKRTDVVPVTLWDPSPEDGSVRLGDHLWVAGSVQRRFWSGSEGRQSRLEIVAKHTQIRTPMTTE